MAAIILCYHKVGFEAKEGRKLNVEPARLAQHVEFFARRKKILLAKDFSGEWPKSAACFTFDDAYKTAIDHAAPILEKAGVRGTFFAVSGMLGKTSTWDGPDARPLADLYDLQAIHARGHEIGNHTHTHPRLDLIDPVKQVDEIRRADLVLTAQGLPPASFCYPYGRHTEVSIEEVGRHYPVGMALGKRPATKSDSRLALPRIAVAFSDALPLLLYRIYIRPLMR